MNRQKTTGQGIKRWVAGIVAVMIMTVGVPVNAQSLNSIYFASNFQQKAKEELAQKSDSIFVVNVRLIEANTPSMIHYNVGTSILISEDELITNYHVVQAFAEMNKSDQGVLRVASPAKLSEWIEADVVFSDKERDIAILKLHRKVDYKPVTFADAEDNQSVITVGYPANPGGQLLLLDRMNEGNHTLWNTITKRRIYSSHTSVAGKDYVGNMKKDIAQGNSGGPVLDQRLNVVGMVTFVYEGMTYFLTTATLEEFIAQYRETTTKRVLIAK
jgi:S1-C subfamily serine protease